MIFEMPAIWVAPNSRLFPRNDFEYLKTHSSFWPIEFKKNPRSPRTGSSGRYSTIETEKQETGRNKFPQVVDFVAIGLDSDSPKIQNGTVRALCGACRGIPNIPTLAARIIRSYLCQQ
jgi:hypothetical protein